MRIESLSIERYGIHADRRFDFAPGLQVIYGPNEAGKTTLLQLVRDLFFGYKDRHPYKFDDHAGPLKATAGCVTREGRRFQFTRQKGRPDIVSGEIAGTREPLNADKLDRLIGGISPSTYQQIFAFSLEELRKGGDLLAEAGLHRALFGVGMGGLPQLQAVQQRVQSEREGLLKTSGNAKNPVINNLLIQIQGAREEYKQSTLRPHEYTRQIESLKRHEEQAAELRSQLEELRQEQNRLLRYQKALPIHREISVLQESLSDLPQSGNYPVDAVEQFRNLEARKAELDGELERLHEDETAGEDSSTAALDDERLFKAAGEVRSLLGQHAVLVTQADQQSALTDRIEGSRREFDAQLRQLPANWTGDRLASFDNASTDVEVLERIASESNQIQQRLDRLEQESSKLAAEVESLSRSLEDAPEDPRLPALESLLEAREQDWKLRNRLQEVQREISRLCDELEAHWQAIAAGVAWSWHVPDDIEALLKVPTPLSIAIAEFDREWRILESERNELRVTLQRQQADLKLSVQKLADLQRVGDIPDPARLKALREARDAHWIALKQRWSNPANAVSAGVSSLEDLVSDFQRSIIDCDTFADELLRCAHDVAHQSQLQSDVARLQQSVDETAIAVAADEHSEKAFDRRWQELWRPAGIKPHAPVVMQEWLSQLQQFRQLHAGMLHAEREELELEAATAGGQRELTRAFADAVDLDDAWRRAQQLRDQLREQHSLRARLLQEQHEAASELASIEQQRFAGSLTMAEVQQRGLAITRRYDLPAEWDADVSRRTLQNLCEASRRRTELAQWEALLAEQSREWVRFQSRLKSLFDRVAPDLVSLAAADALAEMESRLQAAESRIEQRRRLAERQTHAERDRMTCLRKRQDVEDVLIALAADCGTMLPELNACITQVETAREKSARIAALQGQLSSILQTGEEAESLTGLDVDAIAGRMQGIADDIRRCEADDNAAQQQVGVIRHELQQCELDEAPLKTAAELASLQARLAHAVDQWAPLALADALMTAARERFQKLHQPRLIAQVERIFTRMTAGEYEKIDCSLDQNADEQITVRHRGGRLRTTGQLSSGTSEQLYLAIRLAYVADYSRLSEPMPMVMDDVLVNFDEQRVLETLGVLLELAESSQILFLTCHRRTIDLLQQLQAGSSIIELNGALARPDADVPLHDEVRLELDAHKSSRRPKRRIERPDQPALFPPNN